MGWVQLAIAVLGFAREVLKQLNAHHKCNAEIVTGLKQFNKSLHTANEKGDTSAVEKMFADIFAKPGGAEPGSSLQNNGQ